VTTPARNARGTFQTEHPRDERTVVEIIRQLVLLAADAFDKDPAEITQAEANSCADQLIGFGPIPKIHGLLAQIPDRHGKPYGYRKLLCDLFDPDRSFEHVARERVGVEDWPDLDEAHIDFALNLAADHDGITTFTPSRYDLIVDALIRADRRRHRNGGGLATRLPSSEQILRFYNGDWNHALVAHGLDPQPVESYQSRAVRTAEAIRRFFEKTGSLPSKKQLTKFARYFQFSLEDWKAPWPEGLDAGRKVIRAAGLVDPPPYRPRIDKPIWEDEHGSRPWDARDPRHRPKHYWTSEAMMIVKVGEFLAEEVGRGRPASQDRYQEWSARQDDRPSLEVLQNYGGLKALVAKAARAGALAKARDEAKREIEPTPDELAERERARLAAIVDKPQAQAILKLVGERGEVGAREIEAALGWGKGTASNWLPYLRQAGLVICTTESPVARNARYRLPGELSEEAKVDAERRRKEELLGHPNGQATLRLLQERGEVTSAEVAEACGFAQGTAKSWLNRLCEFGFGTRDFQGNPGQHGGRRVIYRLIDHP
jgi:predicted transcriptional regulator